MLPMTLFERFKIHFIKNFSQSFFHFQKIFCLSLDLLGIVIKYVVQFCVACL